MNAPILANRAALNDAVQDHLHPALTDTQAAAEWVHKSIQKATWSFGNRDPRQTIAYAREQLREALSELDAFEAAVYPADHTPDNDAELNDGLSSEGVA